VFGLQTGRSVPTLAALKRMTDATPRSDSVGPASCPHAGEPQTPLFDARDYISGDGFALVLCRKCGIAYTQPTPAPDKWSRYYPRDYYGKAGASRFRGPIEWVQNQFYTARVGRIQQFNGGRPGRVLDVGCGRGFLLQEFRRRGWDVLGTEVDGTAAAHAQRVLQLPVKIGALETLKLPADGFDVVVLWHVLEHLSDPGATLVQVHRLLRPGGTLLVGVPNFGSAEARWCQDKWFHLDVPRHLTHFTQNGLARALEQAGLRVCGRGRFAPEYDAFSLVQSLLNCVGLRPNYLYNLLRGRDAKVFGKPHNEFAQLLVSLLLAVPLAAASLPVTLLAGALGQGSALTIYARKP